MVRTSPRASNLQGQRPLSGNVPNLTYSSCVRPVLVVLLRIDWRPIWQLIVQVLRIRLAHVSQLLGRCRGRELHSLSAVRERSSPLPASASLFASQLESLSGISQLRWRMHRCVGVSRGSRWDDDAREVGSGPSYEPLSPILVPRYFLSMSAWFMLLPYQVV